MTTPYPQPDPYSKEQSQSAYSNQAEQPAYNNQPAQYGRPRKNFIVALLLSIFLGTFGIDRFYLGHIGLGVAKLLLSWATFGVWQIIDLILIAMRKVDDSQFEWDDIQYRQGDFSGQRGY